MLHYEALTRIDRKRICLLADIYANRVFGRDEFHLHSTCWHLSCLLCDIIYKYRIVAGVVTTKHLTVKDIKEEDRDLIIDLLTVYKYKYADRIKGGPEDERPYLNIVYRRLDNLVLKYY